MRKAWTGPPCIDGLLFRGQADGADALCIARGQIAVDLPASVSVMVLLLNEMIAQGKRPAELARLMNARPQEVTRLMDLHHPTKIDTIAAALQAMDRRLDLRLA